MDKLYFGEEPKTSNKKKIVVSALAVLAVVGVVATFAVYSNSSPSTYALQQYNIDEQEFFGFVAKYNKNYESLGEFNRRFKIFRDNTAYARVHNTLGRSYTLGVTLFSDLTHDEFAALYTPNKYQPDEVDASVPVFTADPSVSLPANVDWRTQGAVTPVKNQGQCGSCWAFSTTGSTEGAWFLSGKTLTSLSEQELVDCSGSYGNNGCSGGLMTNAFKYVMANGLTTETTYPYKAVQGKCQTALVAQKATTIVSYSTVSPNNGASLMAAVANAPVSVAVEANQAAWQLYTGGIVSSDCGTALDHGVLIVGYTGTTNWIVKNSWGASWGEAGYIRIAYSASGAGVCGINMQPSFPTEK